MKKIKYCKVIIFLLLLWFCLSAAGYAGKDTIYSAYSIDVWKDPYFTLVFNGIHDQIYPWELLEDVMTVENQDSTDDFLSGQWTVNEQNELTISENDTETEETQINDTISSNDRPILPYHQVEESYFDDAVFIGDSRTAGLEQYGGLEKATFYDSVGLNIYDLWTSEFCEVDGEKLTLEEALSKRSFQKIYFQIGINELGRGTLDGFMEKYVETVDKFKELQPDAIIFVQGIMRVTQKKSDADPIFNNPAINERNNRIRKLSDQRTVFYIDMNEVVCDENGALKQNLTFDDLHLFGGDYDIWVDFLKTKGITPQWQQQ